MKVEPEWLEHSESNHQQIENVLAFLLAVISQQPEENKNLIDGMELHFRRTSASNKSAIFSTRKIYKCRVLVLCANFDCFTKENL